MLRASRVWRCVRFSQELSEEVILSHEVVGVGGGSSDILSIVVVLTMRSMFRDQTGRQKYRSIVVVFTAYDSGLLRQNIFEKFSGYI